MRPMTWHHRPGVSRQESAAHELRVTLYAVPNGRLTEPLEFAKAPPQTGWSDLGVDHCCYRYRRASAVR
jgi:hypothetical protein